MNRIERVREKIAEQKLSGFIVTDKMNRRYLCGFTGSNGLLLITENKLYLFVDGRYTQQASQQTSNVEICEISVGESFSKAICPFISEMRLGFEAETISYQTYIELLSLVKEVHGQLIPTRNIVETIRMIKSPEEISALRKAASIADQTLEMILPTIRFGMTEIELANELDYHSKKLGSEGPAFETIVASGVRTSLPHAHASHKKIAANELIMIDFGTIYQGYYSDITRTIGFGEIDDNIQKKYSILLEAQKKAVQAVSFNKTVKEIDLVARQELEKKGLEKYFSHNLGHGIGLSCHEYPDLSPKTDLPIQTNMTFTIEPGIYFFKEKYGIRIEDDVLVDDVGKAELLTNFNKEWISIDCNR
jgi:Xaa-Pro aminopeptidase